MGFLPLDQIDLLDAFLESLAILGYIFVILMIFYAKRKNKIFASKGFPIMVIAIILGLLASAMDLFTELYWFDTFEEYNVFKSVIAGLKISSLIIFAFSLLILFKFTKFMMGEDLDK